MMSRGQDLPSEALSQSSGRVLQLGCGCFGVFFFGIFLLVGSAGTYMLLWQPLTEHWSLGDWVETPCEISALEFERSGDHFVVDVTYNYEYGGNDYESQQFRADHHLDRNRVDKRSDISYAVGDTTVCYVNPEHPSEAVLDNSLPFEIVFGLIPLVFVVIGLVGIIASLFARSTLQTMFGGRDGTPIEDRARAFIAAYQSGSSESLSGPVRQVGKWQVRESDLSSWLPKLDATPQELKGANSVRTTFLLLLAFGGFWNFVVSIFVSQVIASWLDGDPDWFLTLFMLPFVAVGLGLGGGAIYYFLALFNPRPEMYVSAKSFRQGDELRIKWVLVGSVRSIREFQIKLIGEEKAEYRRGTSTYTDTSTFCEQVVFNTTDPYEIESGEATVQAPADSMHTFSAAHNQVTWKLQMKGDIPFWPDVSQDYPVGILPGVD